MQQHGKTEEAISEYNALAFFGRYVFSSQVNITQVKLYSIFFYVRDHFVQFD